MLEAANPAHDAFDSHAEAAVRNAAEFAQVKVPLESLFGKAMLLNPLYQQIVRGHALRSADDLSMSFRRQHVHAQRQVGTQWIRLHVERFYLRRITVHHDRLLAL